MKIVIDVPKYIYEHIKEVYEHSQTVEATYSYIYHGTPLPEGHGRLKDVDHYIKMQWEHPDYSLMDDEPTIIEADTESEVEK